MIVSVLYLAATTQQVSLAEAEAELHALVQTPGFTQVVRPFGTCLQTATNELTVRPADLADVERKEQAFVSEQLKQCGEDQTEARLVRLVQEHDKALPAEHAALRAKIGMGTIRAGFERNVKVKFGLFPVVAVPPKVAEPKGPNASN